MTSLHCQRAIAAALLALCFSLAPAQVQAQRGDQQENRVLWSSEQENEAFDGFIVHYKDDLRFIDDPRANSDGSGHKKAVNDISRLSGVFNVEIKYERRLATGGHLISAGKLDASSARAFMHEMAKNPDVHSIELNSRAWPMQVVDDIHYSKQWALWDAVSGIAAPAAWERATGNGVVVAVLDTGYTLHPDLDEQTIAGYDFIRDALEARDGTSRDPDPKDEGDWRVSSTCGTGTAPSNSSWHGTHVAGIIAAQTNNGTGMAGVAYGAKIQHVRVLGRCGGTVADISDAIFWASGGTVQGVPDNETPARVINLSLGGTGACGITYQLAIDAARARKSLVVVAAGNEDSPAAGSRPANCNNVISVAATNRAGQRAGYSNYGARVDISAPGGETRGNSEGGIISTVNIGTSAPTEPGYAYYQGTSMAAPHVSGVAALLVSMKPQLSVSQLTDILKNSSRPFPSMCKSGCGVGMLDADAATKAVTNAPTSAPLSVTTQGYGSVMSTPSGIACGQQCSSRLTLGGTVTLTATPRGGNEFAGWAGKACSGSSPTCTIDFSKAHSVIATFRAKVGKLANGSVRENLAMIDRQDLQYQLNIPAGATDLKVEISGGTGDADLHVRHESDSVISCSNYSIGNNEQCNFATPMAGTYRVRLAAYPEFSGVRLKVSYRAGPAGGASLTNGVAATGLAVQNGALYYKIRAPAKSENLRISASRVGTAPYMYVRYGAVPTSTEYDCRTGLSTDPAECILSKPRSGTYYVMLKSAYSSIATSGISLSAKFDDYSSRQQLNLNFSGSSNGIGRVVVRRVSSGEDVFTCSLTPCKVPLPNASFDLIAVPSRGMVNTGWRSGHCDSITSDGNCRLRMSASRWVNTNFSTASTTAPLLTISTSGNGSGVVDIRRTYYGDSIGSCTSFPCRMGPGSNTSDFLLDTFTLVARPEMTSNMTGYSWTGCDSRPSSNSCQVRIDRLKNVSVTFTKK